MGQSLAQNYIHIVFSTKHRTTLIHEPVQSELWSYLGGICRKTECHPIKIGGHIYHIHILSMLSKKIALMKFIKEVKSLSSKWMKTMGKSLREFYWQDGYGALSVNPYEIEVVKTYIENQREHHKKNYFSGRIQGFFEKV